MKNAAFTPQSVSTSPLSLPRLARLFLAPLLLLLVACGEYGQVEQGRVVAFDEKSGTFSLVTDVSPVRGKVDYSGVPATEFKLPTVKDEIGALPKAGLLLDIDLEKHAFKVYDAAGGGIRELVYTVVEEKTDIGSKHALVYDEAAKKARELPALNTTDGTVEVYLKDRKLFVKARLTPEQLAMPIQTFTPGDEARIYFHQAPQTLRFMNVTRTDIFSK